MIKNYAAMNDEGQRRYSPAQIISAEKVPVFGSPDSGRICTSHVERANLTLRMQVRRFTRLTNAHSKSLKHHKAMQAIYFCWYNFCRKHSTLGKTPAMESGITEKPLKISNILS